MNSNIIWFLYFYYLSYLRLYLKKKNFDPLFDNAVFAFNFIYLFILRLILFGGIFLCQLLKMKVKFSERLTLLG